jgi:iron complex transport system substrate-binding protein
MEMRGFLCALALAWACPAWAEAPRRVVSLDYCADQFVLALADRGQIAALSRGARREDSYYRAYAAGLRQTRGSLEEVLALHPDLVVRNWGGPWDAAEVYARFGVPVLQVGEAPDFHAARADLLNAAMQLGQVERGRALAADMDRRLARLTHGAPAARPAVMYLSAGGAVAGSGILMDAVIEAAGGRNVWSGPNWSVLPLERMIELPPALIVLGFFDTGRTRMNAWSPSRHPALQRALSHARTVSLPATSVSCEAWYAVEAAEQIALALRVSP